jgi:hypothetical protein
VRPPGGLGLTSLLPALILVACAGSFETRVADVQPMPARIAVMPARVAAYDLPTGSAPMPDVAGSLYAASIVDAAVAAWVRGQGGRTFDGTVVGGTSPRYDELRPWMEQAMQEISVELIGTAKARHRSVGDWRWRGDLAPWRATLGADFVLLVRLWDERWTAGRYVVNQVLPFAATRPDRTELACLLSLVDGRIVVCSGASTHGFTVTTEAGEREQVSHVLDGLFSAHGNWSR